ncbi:MAG: lysoplasmalogenase [Vicinamibacteria bacterium]|nr:lysoplasmalogenase [Vicinamibacteria bacterium]
MAWALAAFAALAYLLGGEALGAWAPLLKAMPVSVLAALVFHAVPRMERRLTAFGLLIAALADAIIEFSFVGGLGAFLLAHLFYIAAFTRVEPRGRVLRLLPVATWAAVALPVLVSHAGPLRIPVLVYGLVIFTMIWRAAAAVSITGWNPGTMGLAGAILFGCSDTLLGYTRFVEPVQGSRFLVLGTYWLGQALIARSFLLAR